MTDLKKMAEEYWDEQSKAEKCPTVQECYLAGAQAALELAAQEADKSVKHCHCNLRIRSLASSGGSGEEGGT